MPVTNPITLLSGQTTNGGAGVDWGGGPGLLTVYGTWGTASVELSYSSDGGTTYIPTDGGLFTTDGALNVAFGTGKVKAAVTGVTTGTNLNAKLESTR